LPVYEYRCSKGHEYERTEGFDAPTRQKCDCGATANRLISRPAVIFKGSGFYSTDNRKSSVRQDTPSVDSVTNGSSPKSDKDSKPDTSSKVEAAVD
jgi:putative FmdB family regulatory protein